LQILQIKKFAGIGGVTLKDLVFRILRALIKDEIATQFSWNGKKGKKEFVLLEVKDAIFGMQ